jgi:hypothetical protein
VSESETEDDLPILMGRTKVLHPPTKGEEVVATGDWEVPQHSLLKILEPMDRMMEQQTDACRSRASSPTTVPMTLILLIVDLQPGVKNEGTTTIVAGKEEQS